VTLLRRQVFILSLFLASQTFYSGCAAGPVANRSAPASNTQPTATPAVTAAPDRSLNVPTNLSPPPGKSAESSEAGGLEKKALAGDYQSQRNLAYYLTTGEEGVKADPVMACAWRIVILKSNHSQADASDTGNKQFDCDRKLTPAQLRQAEVQAAALMKRIRK
jgi:hypothetical protein